MIDILSAKSILILGFGREGRSTYNYLIRQLKKSVKLGIYDQSSSEELKLNPDISSRATLHLGEPLLPSLLNKYDLIIKSPGIPDKTIPANLWSNITSPTQIFFEACKAPIIGVTGTKGKSTTSSLIHQILIKGGKTAILIGNIGTPALDELSKITKNSLVVFELSCHQLSHLSISPHIAVILGIFPEHLDYYETFSQYLAAKSSICKYQKSQDSVIYYAENEHSSALASISLAEKIPIHDKDTLYFDSIKPILIGKMNRINMAIATKVSEIIGINPQIAIDVCRQFNPLPYRLEDIGEYQQIRFINDSLATIPQATIQALDAFKDQVETLILGGHDRHVDYTPLARALLESKVKSLIFFPPVGKIIWELLNKLDASKANQFQAFFVTDMKSAVKIVYEHTSKGKICLLSPGASSFSNFRDYQDRGNQFKKYVKELSHS